MRGRKVYNKKKIDKVINIKSPDDQSHLTFEQCQRLTGPIRDDLELFDYTVRSAFSRLLAEANLSDENSIMFIKASTTVLLSISAGLHESVAADSNQSFDINSFVASAKSAARWAASRKLRLALGGEA